MGKSINNVGKKFFTVGELKKELQSFPDDSQLIFGDNELTFYRTKLRDEKVVQIEFNEVIERVIK